MNTASLVKGQRVEYQSISVRMEDGEFVNTATVVQGVVVGNSQKGLSIRQDGAKRSWLVSPGNVIKVL